MLTSSLKNAIIKQLLKQKHNTITNKKPNTVADFIKNLSVTYANNDALIFKGKFRTSRYTYKKSYNQVRQTITFFKEKGVKKGDRIIICFYNSPQWVNIFLACAISGIIAVPLDFKSNSEFINKIQKQTNAKIIFTSHFKSIDSKIKFPLENLFHSIKNLKPNKTDFKIQSEDILEIVYTSGTTSAPKGVILTNKNVVSNIHSLSLVMKPTQKDRFLSIIPLSHMLEQSLGFFIPMRFGASITYTLTQKSKAITQAMIEEKISYMVTVPAFLQIFKNKIENKVKKEKSVKSFKKLLSLPRPIKTIILNKKIPFLKHLKHYIVGGSALDKNIDFFWKTLGVTVLQGYGLTETSPIMTASTDKHVKIGSVGKVLPYQEIKLLKDNEIICKGDNVFNGYYKNKKETSKVIKNKWFYTGDLGKIDSDGFLKIIGRKKNMILTDSGLNVYPEDIELALNAATEVEDSCVLSIEKNKTNIIVAAITLSKNTIKFKKEDFIKKINEKLLSHQKVQKLIVWSENDFPRTPSLKIKRKDVKSVIENFKKENNNKKNQIKTDKLVSIIKDISGLKYSEIKLNSNLYTDLNIDSLRRVELLSHIEEEYEVEIAEDKISDKTTVETLKKLIKTSKTEANKNVFKYWSFSKLIWPLRYILQSIILLITKFFYTQKVSGLKNLKNIKGPVIFTLNHTSHLDTPTLIRALPYKWKKRLAFAAAEDYFFKENKSEIKWLKKVKILFLRIAINIYPFSRDTNIKRTLKVTGKILDKNYSIAIFPEGTRTLNGEMNHYLSGIGLLAAEMQVPIIPIKTTGLFKLMPKGKNWPKHGKATIKFGKPYTPSINKSYIQIAGEIEDLTKNL